MAALIEIQRKSCMRVAAMTLGAHGALAYTQGRFHYSPAFIVNCIDTTGAGDVFHGAFCYAVLQQMPIADALEFSNAMAALNCTAPGARGHIASGEEVSRFMQSGVARREHPAIAIRVKAG
jgi:sugar/nucleoside kinase (ribokinase family)